MKIRILLVSLLCPLFHFLKAEDDPTLRLVFTHESDGALLFLDSLRYKSTSDETYSLSRVSYLISEIALETSSGNWVEVDTIGYIDAAKRLTSIDFLLPPNTYRSIRFNIGLPEDLNHSDPSQYPIRHALHPDYNNLHWTWATGYIFMALEGRVRFPEGKIGGFVYHLANDVNLVPIQLPLNLFHIEHTLIEIGFDLNKVLGSPQSLSFQNDGYSTHSHKADDIALKLVQNLLGSFQINRIQEFSPKKKSTPPRPIDLPDLHTPYEFKMSRHFPMPDLPTDNPLVTERVELGKELFFDPILSTHNTISCVTCHNPKNAFSDTRIQSTGTNSTMTRRHSMPLFNLAWKEAFFWDGRATSLREQVFHPILALNEMGSSVDQVIKKLQAETRYKELFAKAFNPGTITQEHIELALENYLLTLVSYHSRFDEAISGKTKLTKEEKRGFELFMTEYEPRSNRFGADCFHCHGGALFTDNQFHNNGLFPSKDLGKYEYTAKNSDRFKFATPSLRNIELTAPYMHDGSLATLEDVVAHYNSGIHNSETLDPNLAKHPPEGIQLSEADERALVAFLKSLTDPQYLEYSP